MVRLLIFLISYAPIACFSSSMSSMESKGCSFGKAKSDHTIKKMKRQKFKEPLPGKKSFDPKKALHSLKNNEIPHSEAVDFLTSKNVQRNESRRVFQEEELFFKHSEELFAQYNQPENNLPIVKHEDFSIHTCRQSGDPVLMTIERTLNVKVFSQQKEVKHICKGHLKWKSFKKKGKGDFNSSIKDYKNLLENDSTIKSYEIIPCECIDSTYFAIVKYKHVNNALNCKKHSNKVLKEASFHEMGDQWVYDYPDLWELAKDPNSTIIETICLDSSPSKIIKGKEVDRKCWKERISFLYQFPETHECDFLKENYCEQISQTCIQLSPFGCSTWEVAFKCFNQIELKYNTFNPHEIYGLESNHNKVRYRPNRTFAEAITKLSVFNEAKKDLEKSQALDARDLEVFKGKKKSCSKSVADNLLYDCCFSYSGIAKKAGLSKCNSDEIGLSEMREAGLCHYVGSYEEKVLNLWKSRDEHVFCCFSSKLSRLVQEEGRKQLKQDWGTPESPNCEGFSFELISKLNFSEMDLSDLFDQIPKQLPDHFQDKMQNFQSRLQEQIQNEDS